MAKNPARLVSQVVTRVIRPKKMIMMGTKMKPNFYMRKKGCEVVSECNEGGKGNVGD
jgi:hypothetical protein